MKDSIDYDQQSTLAGHPTGLFTLFFAEMWERVADYGMRSLLVFYMLKGFLGYDRKESGTTWRFLWMRFGGSPGTPD